MGEEVGDELAACVVFIRKAYSSGDKNEGVNGKTCQWRIKEHHPMKGSNTAKCPPGGSHREARSCVTSKGWVKALMGLGVEWKQGPPAGL